MGNRIALVTGAGRNLGRAIALALAEAGTDVILNARSDLPSLRDVAREVEALGRRAWPVLADVAEETQVSTMVDSALEQFGQIDILVNNAGPRGEAPIDTLTTAAWRAVLGPILDGAFYCSRAVLPGMRERKWGRVINILGAVAHSGQPQRAHLAAAKAGVLGLTRALAAEVGGDGVTVNAVSPGVLDTALPLGIAPERRLRRVQTNPIPRLGQPEEVGRLCAYLAGDDAGFITGQAFAINGGEVMLG